MFESKGKRSSMDACQDITYNKTLFEEFGDVYKKSRYLDKYPFQRSLIQNLVYKVISARNEDGFSTYTLCMILEILVRYNIRHKELDLETKECLESALHIHADRFDNVGISKALKSMSKMNFVAEKTLVERLLKVVLMNSTNFNPQQVSNTIAAICKLQWDMTPDIKKGLLLSLDRNVSKIIPHGLTNVISAICKLQLKLQEQQISNLLNALNSKANFLNEDEISDLLYALAKLEWVIPSPLNSSLSSAIARVMSCMSSERILSMLSTAKKLSIRLNDDIYSKASKIISSSKDLSVDFSREEFCDLLSSANAFNKSAVGLSRDVALDTVETIEADNYVHKLDDASYIPAMTYIYVPYVDVEMYNNHMLQEIYSIMRSILDPLGLNLQASTILGFYQVDLYMPQLNVGLKIHQINLYDQFGTLNMQEQYNISLVISRGYNLIEVNGGIWNQLHDVSSRRRYLVNIIYPYLSGISSHNLYHDIDYGSVTSFKEHANDERVNTVAESEKDSTKTLSLLFVNSESRVNLDEVKNDVNLSARYRARSYSI